LESSQIERQISIYSIVYDPIQKRFMWNWDWSLVSQKKSKYESFPVQWLNIFARLLFFILFYFNSNSTKSSTDTLASIMTHKTGPEWNQLIPNSYKSLEINKHLENIILSFLSGTKTACFIPFTFQSPGSKFNNATSLEKKEQTQEQVTQQVTETKKANIALAVSIESLQSEYCWASLYGVHSWFTFLSYSEFFNVSFEGFLLQRKQIVDDYIQLFIFWKGNRYAAFTSLQVFWPHIAPWNKACRSWSRSFSSFQNKNNRNWLFEFNNHYSLRNLSSFAQTRLFEFESNTSLLSNYKWSKTFKSKKWSLQSIVAAATHCYFSRISNTKPILKQCQLFYFPHQFKKNRKLQPATFVIQPTLVDYMYNQLNKHEECLDSFKILDYLKRCLVQQQSFGLFRGLMYSNWIQKITNSMIAFEQKNQSTKDKDNHCEEDEIINIMT
jgi:hypothetical protein